MSSQNKLFITGATGFLGGAILAQLLNEGRINEVLLLVRAGTVDEGLKRITDQLKLFELPEALIATVGPDNIVLGDLGDASWGQDPRAQSIRTIINSAAVASFGTHPRIWEVNVNDSFTFAKTAAELPGLKRFLHVGTGMACGVQAESPVAECYDVGNQALHLVPYTHSKATIEARMRDELPDLPLVVARPSIVVGHTTLGCKPSSSIFWVFRMAKVLGEFLCDYDDKIDVIPVDWCAAALLSLADKPTLGWNRYHVSAGPESSCSFREIDAALSAALHVPPAENYKHVDFDHMMSRSNEFPALFGVTDPKLILKSIKLYGGFSALSFIFENGRLRGEGVPAAPRVVDYLALCVETTKDISLADQMSFDFK